MTLPSFCSPSKRIGAIGLECRDRSGDAREVSMKPAPRRRIPSPAFAPLVQNATCVRMTTASNWPPTGVPVGVPEMPPPAAVEKRLLILPWR
jgi:hypothetical protein